MKTFKLMYKPRKGKSAWPPAGREANGVASPRKIRVEKDAYLPTYLGRYAYTSAWLVFSLALCIECTLQCAKCCRVPNAVAMPWSTTVVPLFQLRVQTTALIRSLSTALPHSTSRFSSHSRANVLIHLNLQSRALVYRQLQVLHVLRHLDLRDHLPRQSPILPSYETSYFLCSLNNVACEASQLA